LTAELVSPRVNGASYEKYLLSDNPFPQSAVVKINEPDIRVNGSIFLESVFKEREIKSLREKFDNKTNMIYLAGLQVEKGVGKSALLVHEWRTLRDRPDIPSAYVRCAAAAPLNRVSGFCSSIVSEIHRGGWLWKAFERHMLAYCDEKTNLRIERAGLETMFRMLRWPVQRFSFNMYAHVTDAETLAKNFARWLGEKYGIEGETPLIFALCYLQDPSLFPSRFNSKSDDKISMYESVLKILCSAGMTYSYFFLDQWEDAIISTSTSKIGEFSSEMRRMMEASINMATVLVSLHPDSERKLRTKSAEHLLAIAPMDGMHLVDVSKLDKISKYAVPLTEEYMKRFRTGEPSSPIFPFEPEVIQYACFVEDGRIRFFLQRLHDCLTFANQKGATVVNLNFILENHNSCMGTELNEKKLRAFKEAEGL